MEKILSESLSHLGLDRLSVRFLLAAYKIAPAGISEIAASARIKRSTAYLLTQQLLSSGFLLQDHKKYANRIYPIPPEDILRRISGSQRRLRRTEIELEEKLPEIRAAYQISNIRPRVTLFEGNSGLLQIWTDILSAQTEILLWTNQQTENLFFGPVNHDRFITERLTKNIPIRVLATHSQEAYNLQKTDTMFLRQTKILPKTTKFSSETYIYDNKVALLDYNKDIIGVITESAPIASFHRANFELVWKLLPSTV